MDDDTPIDAFAKAATESGVPTVVKGSEECGLCGPLCVVDTHPIESVPETVKVNLYGHMVVLNESEISHSEEIVEAIHDVVDKLAEKGEPLIEVIDFTIRVTPIESDYMNGLQVVGTSEFHHEKEI